MLSIGDVITVDYSRNYRDPSRFNLVTDVVDAPPTVTAELVVGGDGKVDDVRLVFTPPAGNRSGTRYVFERRTSAHAGPDLECGTEDDLFPKPWTWIGFEPHEGSDGRYRDHDVAVGCHAYRLIAKNPATGAAAAPVYANAVERPVL